MLHELLRIFQDLPNIVGTDVNVPFGINKLRAKGREHRSGGVHGVGCRAETNAEGHVGLFARFGRLQHRVVSPVLGLGRGVC